MKHVAKRKQFCSTTVSATFLIVTMYPREAASGRKLDLVSVPLQWGRQSRDAQSVAVGAHRQLVHMLVDQQTVNKGWNQEAITSKYFPSCHKLGYHT